MLDVRSLYGGGVAEFLMGNVTSNPSPHNLSFSLSLKAALCDSVWFHRSHSLTFAL